MAPDQLERRLLAILATDVVGYSRLMDADEPGTIAALKAVRAEIVDPLIESHHGRTVKWMGDGALVTFESVVDAVACAVDLQRAMVPRNANLPEAERIMFRVGINLGDIALVDGDVYGEGVNVAARLEQLCDSGGVLVSGTAFDHLRGKLDVPLDFVGEQQVKNIARPVRTYRVRLDGAPARPKLRAQLRPRRVVGVTIVTLALIAAGAWWHWTGGLRSAMATPSIAVLPFKNNGDEASGRMADGITDDIITDLSRYRDFDVIARNSTEVYKGKPVDVRQVGLDLNVRYVLEGSFQREGEQVRITVQLIDAGTRAHVWSERYDKPAVDVFAVQSEVADKVANSLGGTAGRISEHDVAAAKRKRPADLSAYELYLLGRETMNTGLTDESQLKAERLLERAIEIDPTLARAHAVLAWTYAWRANLEADANSVIKKMVEEARRAIDLDPMDADAHEALGYAFGMQGDFGQAEIEFEEALRLNPNAFDILTVYSCWAGEFGKAEAGVKAVDRAMRLNPNYPVWAVDCFRYGLAMVGRYEDVLRNQARQPEDKWNSDGYVIMAGSLAELGRLEEAKALAARGIAKYPTLLSIEKFALNHSWTASSSALMAKLMRKAGFPACASDKDLAGIAKPVRLPECVKA